MGNKKNIVLIVLILFFSGVFVLTLYVKFNFNELVNVNYYKIIEPSGRKELSYDFDYYSKYNDKIIKDNITNIEYSLVKEKKVLYGNIFIDNDGKLYIYDELKNKNYLLIDSKIKTIITNETNVRTKFLFYVIAEDGVLYKINILGTNIRNNENIKILKMNLPEKVTNFVDLSIKCLIDDFYKGIVVVGESGRMYHADTLTEYEENTINVFDKYIIYFDKTITDFKGNILNDGNNDYIIKSVIIANEVLTDLKYNPVILFVTSDSKLIYTNKDGKIVEYYKKVKEINENATTAKLIFEDNSYLEFLSFSVTDI